MRMSPEDRPEYIIEEAVISQYKVLGYKAIKPPIRRVLFSKGAGLADLVLMPKGHQHRLVLVEAKHIANKEAADKVVGQLLKYYVGALSLGSGGLKLLEKYAKDNPEKARSVTKKFPQSMSGGLHRDEAFPLMREGEPLASDAIGLVIALDGPAKAYLIRIVRMLRDRHNLPITVVELTEGKLKKVDLQDDD